MISFEKIIQIDAYKGGFGSAMKYWEYKCNEYSKKLAADITSRFTLNFKHSVERPRMCYCLLRCFFILLCDYKILTMLADFKLNMILYSVKLITTIDIWFNFPLFVLQFQKSASLKQSSKHSKSREQRKWKRMQKPSVDLKRFCLNIVVL